MKARILRDVYARGILCDAGAVHDLDPQTLLDLVACNAAVPVDPRDIERAVEASRRLVAALERGQASHWMRAA